MANSDGVDNGVGMAESLNAYQPMDVKGMLQPLNTCKAVTGAGQDESENDGCHSDCASSVTLAAENEAQHEDVGEATPVNRNTMSMPEEDAQWEEICAMTLE